MARIWWCWVGDTWWSNEWFILREFHDSVNDHEIFKLQDWMTGWGWGRNVRWGGRKGTCGWGLVHHLQPWLRDYRWDWLLSLPFVVGGMVDVIIDILYGLVFVITSNTLRIDRTFLHCVVINHLHHDDHHRHPSSLGLHCAWALLIFVHACKVGEMPAEFLHSMLVSELLVAKCIEEKKLIINKFRFFRLQVGSALQIFLNFTSICIYIFYTLEDYICSRMFT